MKSVGVALIFDKSSNKVLIGRRAPTEPFAGYWEFPGGKLEQGETPEEAIQRELMEELNVECSVHNKFDETIYTYSTGKFKLLTYFTTIDESTIEKRVHDELKWVSIKDAHTYNMFPSNIIILDKLKEHFC